VTHFRSMFDSDFAGVWDLDGKDRIVTITKVEPGTVGGQKGKKKDKKAILHFRELSKPFACNVTNARTIAGMYGSHVQEWVGKRITLFATTTEFGRDTVECIRIRPTIPSGESERFEGKPVDRDVREKQERAAQRADTPANVITAAKTADEMLEAIRSCAGWIREKREERWEWTLKCAAKRGVSEADATLALELAAEGA
jgi:hypothetical protein